MYASLPSDKLWYSSWLIPYWRNSLLQSLRSCIWVRPISVPMDMHHVTDCVMSFSVMWIGLILWLTYFVLFIFAFQLCMSFRDYLNCNRVQFPYNFLFLMWLSPQMFHVIVGPFIFRFWGYLYSLMAAGQIIWIRFIYSFRETSDICTKAAYHGFSSIW